jgi:hypothetical protein
MDVGGQGENKAEEKDIEGNDNAQSNATYRSLGDE